MKKLFACLIMVCCLMFACGKGTNNSDHIGPTKAEADAVLKEQITQFAQMSGISGLDKSKMNQIEVTDIKCSKEGEDIYGCEVQLKLPFNQKISSRERYTKIDGKWKVEHIK